MTGPLSQKVILTFDGQFWIRSFVFGGMSQFDDLHTQFKILKQREHTAGPSMYKERRTEESVALYCHYESIMKNNCANLVVPFLGLISLLAYRFHLSVPLALQSADFSLCARRGKQWRSLQHGYKRYLYFYYIKGQVCKLQQVTNVQAVRLLKLFRGRSCLLSCKHVHVSKVELLWHHYKISLCWFSSLPLHLGAT